MRPDDERRDDDCMAELSASAATWDRARDEAVAMQLTEDERLRLIACLHVAADSYDLGGSMRHDGASMRAAVAARDLAVRVERASLVILTER